MKYKIEFKNEDLETVVAKKGTDLLVLLQNNNIFISADCNGRGSCGNCKVKIIKGQAKLTKLEKLHLTNDEIESGIRLACKQKVEDNLLLKIEGNEDFKILEVGQQKVVDYDFELKKEKITLPEQINKDLLSIIYKKSGYNQIDSRALTDLNQIGRGEISLISHENKILELKEKGLDTLLALAVDIGTTTVVIVLINLETGAEIDLLSFQNPQSKFGADVISRVEYTLEARGNLKQVKEILIKAINKNLKTLLLRNDAKVEDVYLANIVANTVMAHILLGLKAETLVKAPYTPLLTEEIELTTEQSGLIINKRGLIQMPPAISAYIGSDIVADLLTIEITKQQGLVMLIDLGTNGEIVLGNKEQIFACSTAAGPAFEGGNIKYGMGAVSGAISNYLINDDSKEILFNTINDRPAKGICGSGLLDIIAQLYRHDFINQTGAFVARNNLSTWQKTKLDKKENRVRYKVLEDKKRAENIVLTQKDIREFQLAKAAILAGIKILQRKADVGSEEIKKVYLAGGFGNYIDLSNAFLLKLLPAEFKGKVKLIGNGAISGAKLGIKNKGFKYAGREIKDKTTYFDLSRATSFQKEFIAAMDFSSEEVGL